MCNIFQVVMPYDGALTHIQYVEKAVNNIRDYFMEQWKSIDSEGLRLVIYGVVPGKALTGRRITMNVTYEIAEDEGG